jgi:hypothetical protein
VFLVIETPLTCSITSVHKTNEKKGGEEEEEQEEEEQDEEQEEGEKEEEEEATITHLFIHVHPTATVPPGAVKVLHVTDDVLVDRSTHRAPWEMHALK